jgi:diguanylate cyclase (GGDEF)-like protein
MLGRGVVVNDPSGGTIWIVEDITQSRAAREQLSWTATHDSLTLLSNRREFEARLASAIPQFDGRDVCVMFIDLDHFKAINDNAGHAAGDEVLRQIARLLESKVRQSDTVGRMGGDEFAVLLPGCSTPRAQAIAEQMRLGVENWSLTYEGKVFSVGASIGLVQVASDLPDVAAVLNAADSACYDAKRAGKNRVATFMRATPVN